jgi:hypothetical protein
MLSLLWGCSAWRTDLTDMYPSQPPPWVLQKTADGQVANALVPDTTFTASLDQLSVPRGPCHIKVLDLPTQYQQKADEKRLDYVISADAKKKELEVHYPILRDYLSVSRAWVSADKKTIAFLLYDPLGDFILLSQDSGVHWTPPLYLGIHRLPEAWYASLADSRLPLVSNGQVQIEVTIWKKDKTKRGSPLEGYTYLWKKWNQYLSFHLDDLQRDTDGDGLTDLFEERILTNPYRSDTDKDGIPDGMDNQPLTPFPKTMTESDEVMLSLIPNHSGLLITAIFELWRETKDLFISDDDSMTDVLTKKGIAHFTSPRSKPIPMIRTSVVIASGDSFPHITGDVRVIVLTERAFQRYMEKFPEESHLCAHSFDLRFDRSRKVAVLKQFFANSGSTIILWKERGRWLSSQREQILCD